MRHIEIDLIGRLTEDRAQALIFSSAILEFIALVFTGYVIMVLGIFPKAFFQGQLPKCAFSFPKWQLPKS